MKSLQYEDFLTSSYSAGAGGRLTFMQLEVQRYGHMSFLKRRQRDRMMSLFHDPWLSELFSHKWWIPFPSIDARGHAVVGGEFTATSFTGKCARHTLWPSYRYLSCATVESIIRENCHVFLENICQVLERDVEQKYLWSACKTPEKAEFLAARVRRSPRSPVLFLHLAQYLH